MLKVRALLVVCVVCGPVLLPGCNSVYHKGTRDMAPEPQRFVVRVQEAGEAARAVQSAMGAAGNDVSGAAWEFERRVLSARDVYARLEPATMKATRVMAALEDAVAAANSGGPDMAGRVAAAVRAAEEYAGAGKKK